MSDEIYPIELIKDQQPPAQQPPPKARFQLNLKPLLKNKSIILGVGMLAVICMGTYIIVAPSEVKKPITQIFVPPTPTPTIKAPTPGPTEAVASTPIPAIPTSSPTPKPTTIPTPTIIPAKNWKVYYNTQYNYNIKYSPDWIFKNLGALEPKIPSYVVFFPPNASDSARAITVSVSTRSYAEQLALAASSSAVKVAGVTGTKQYFQDSDGNISAVVTLPRSNDLLVIRAKAKYYTYFDIMLSTLQLSP